jgi:uncharacterized protein (TIGR02284 family)
MARWNPCIAKKFSLPQAAQQQPIRRENMNRKSAAVQRLINALDDSRLVYGKGASKVADPRLHDLLERMACTHWSIADDLAEWIVETGGKAARRGSRLVSLRTFFAEKFAQISFDVEMAYASHAVKHEAAILRDFRKTVASTRDAGLGNRLQLQCRKIEHASTEIRCLRATLELHMGVAARAGTRDRARMAFTHAPAVRGTGSPRTE